MAFFQENCEYTSNSVEFGIYDPPAEDKAPAFLVDGEEYTWMAAVQNSKQDNYRFYAIDNCIIFPARPDGKARKRCDGVLISNDKIAFIELKSSNRKGSDTINSAIKQLLSSISHFKTKVDDSVYNLRRAYISNNQQPYARRGQAGKIEQFAIDTDGYTLFMKYEIDLNDPAG